MHKLEALTRLLEVEPFDAVLIFVRTKTATSELAERLEARGYAAAAMNGDMVQKQREQMVVRLKKGSLDILVATDVAARGLDVDRISHVVNFDIPYDPEAYIQRFAGRVADARPSMLQDHEARRRSEIDAINGMVPVLGRQLGLPTPVNETLTAIVRFREARFGADGGQSGGAQSGGSLGRAAGEESPRATPNQ